MKINHRLLTTLIMFTLAGCQQSSQEIDVAVVPELDETVKVSVMSADKSPKAPEQKYSPNLEREKRMAAEIEDAILEGEPVYLSNGEYEFLSIDTQPESASRGAVVILHGRGFHPNWQDAIYPLRTGLAEAGWRTLSVQMPVLEKDAKYYDYLPLFGKSHGRIEVAIEYLQEQGEKKVVLLAHSCGTHMAMHWIDEVGDESIEAFVGIGMGATDYQQPMRQPFPLAQLKVPVLDIYGGEDYPGVIKMAASRIQRIQQAGNPLSSQKMVPEANHYFTDKGGALVSEVAGWLETL